MYHGIMKVYFDGGCRPNPGSMSVCIVITGSGDPEIHIEHNIGHGTNNVAEWLAILWAASFMQERGITEYQLLGDSNLIINQAQGKYKCSDQFQPYLKQFKEISKGCKVSLQHVYRDANLAGIALENSSKR